MSQYSPGFSKSQSRAKAHDSTKANHQSRSQVIAQLSQQVRKLERSRIRIAGSDGPQSTGIDGLDRLLPESGLQPGLLLEWLEGEDGSGATLLAMMVAREIIRSSGAGVLFVIDPHQEFYPPAAAALGIDLDRTIVVRPQQTADINWTLEQVLRSPGVAACLCRVDYLSNQVFRRIKLAVEAGGGIGLLLRPQSVRRQHSWADVRLLVQSQSSSSESAWSRRINVEMLRCRGKMDGESVDLEVSDETGLVRVVPELGHSADSAHEATA